LRTFLKDPKNSDEANAHLQMAFLLESKAERNDLLDQNDALVTNCDSAIYYFGLAKEMITEKEISKNDDYYQSYSRRDLRTGKFGIKLSDVHYDIEKRVEALENQRKNASKVYNHFVGFTNSYHKADSIFLWAQETFSNQNNLSLMSTEEDQKKLMLLSSYFDSTRIHFNKYKEYLESFPESNYANQQIDLLSIGRLEEVAILPMDWKKESLKINNYREWVARSIATINTEVKAMKENLVTYNSQVDKLMKKIMDDSTAAETELAQLVDRMISDDIKKYDENPFPLTLLNFKVQKIALLNFIFENSLEEKSLKDRLSSIQKILELVNQELQLINLASKYDLNLENKKYSNFISQLGGIASLEELILTSKDETQNSIYFWMMEEKNLLERMDWAIAGEDSISLKPESRQASRYLSLMVNDSLETGESFVSGIVNGEQRSSFVAIVDDKNLVDTLFTFSLDPFMDSLVVENIKAISDMNSDKYLSGFFAIESDTISHVNLNLITNNSLNWSNTITIPGIISRINLIDDSGSVAIFVSKNDDEELKMKLDEKGQEIHQ